MSGNREDPPPDRRGRDACQAPENAFFTPSEAEAQITCKKSGHGSHVIKDLCQNKNNYWIYKEKESSFPRIRSICSADHLRKYPYIFDLIRLINIDTEFL